MALTAGVGSDHVDLHAAADAGITVAEITGMPLVIVPVAFRPHKPSFTRGKRLRYSFCMQAPM